MIRSKCETTIINTEIIAHTLSGFYYIKFSTNIQIIHF